MRVKTKYMQGKVTFTQFAAPKGRTCILIGGDRVTVNLPELPLPEDHVAIKDYSECEGVLDTLVQAGIVSAPIGYVRSGYVELPICRILRRSLMSTALKVGKIDRTLQ